MQTHVILSIAVCCILVPSANSIIQYKVRGPPVSSRHPHPAQYTKPKWSIPPRGPTRPFVRPIPVHMASYKVPVLARPPKTPPPMIFPSAVWKTPTAVYRPPVEKPFLTSPPVTQPYDYQINKEPVINVPTIKQIGEKGPIHTIPAPNLSPADKPNVILEEPSQKHTFQYSKESEVSPNSISPNSISPNSISPNAFAAHTLLGAQALPLVSAPHQYQVTENAEPNEQILPNLYTAQKSYYAPDPDQNNLPQKLNHFSESGPFSNALKFYSQDLFASPQQLGPSGLPLSAHDLYQLLNGIPQQQLADSYGLPLGQGQQPHLHQHLVQQPQVVPRINYPLVLNSQQLIQPESGFFNQFNQVPEGLSQDGVNLEGINLQEIKQREINHQGINHQGVNRIKYFKPQLHSFNYEEQSSHSPKENSFAQSRVTADYSLDPEAEGSKAYQNPHEALAQTQYIQQYFTNREDNNVATDDNELSQPDPQETEKPLQILSQLSAKNEISPSMFYSSLPNREAAETLANLQAAGSINSNILKLKQKQSESTQREQMRIYVPDEEEENYDDMEPQASGEKSETAKASNSQRITENSPRIRIYESYQKQKQNADSRNDESSEYEDYSTEEEEHPRAEARQQEAGKSQLAYGSKLKAKTNVR